ncbi:MAG: hypothetical protein P4L81_03620, partial [Candidatus Pacebacteria bacterium]|nr:hypothetical protein [Candidatus Paceibacterota bacterium]
PAGPPSAAQSSEIAARVSPGGHEMAAPISQSMRPAPDESFVFPSSSPAGAAAGSQNLHFYTSASPAPSAPIDSGIFQAHTVRDACRTIDSLLQREGLMRNREIESAAIELRLTSEEYETAANSGELQEAQALLLLAQMQAELLIISKHCASSERAELLEATITTESVLQFAQDGLQRRTRQ